MILCSTVYGKIAQEDDLIGDNCSMFPQRLNTEQCYNGGTSVTLVSCVASVKEVGADSVPLLWCVCKSACMIEGSVFNENRTKRCVLLRVARPVCLSACGGV